MLRLSALLPWTEHLSVTQGTAPVISEVAAAWDDALCAAIYPSAEYRGWESLL